jgi:serine/threonine-protein kinase
MAASDRFDGCEIVKKLHTGPITDLYHAVQEPLGRPVFIKALGSSILPSSPFAASLEREARLLAELKHESILQVYDFVRTDERMWLVLEYVDGPSLDTLLRKVGKLPQATACAIALRVASALAHAHAKGIVHRDVQPKNILLAKDGQVKLVSFAVAFDERMPTAPELLEGGDGYGGPAYMSPEQILGERADARTDVFSLGVVLYEMLCGERPFDGPDDRSTSLRIRRDPIPPLARKAPALSPSLERLTQRCLEKMPSDRFDSSGELFAALEAAARELGPETPNEAVRAALSRAGLSSAPAAKSVPAARQQPKFRLARTLGGLSLCSLLIAGGGTVIQSGAAKREGEASASRAGHKLELLPARRAYLRVVAHPWAHVVVDGQEVETTPFARPIPLSAGSHFVRLDHPNAPSERRTIDLTPGETLLLEVTLKVSNAAAPSASAGSSDAGPAQDNTP